MRVAGGGRWHGALILAVGVAALTVAVPAVKIDSGLGPPLLRAGDDRQRESSSDRTRLTAVAAAPMIAEPVTGRQVYRSAARLMASYLRTQLQHLPTSDPDFAAIARDVSRFQVLADGAETRRSPRGPPDDRGLSVVRPTESPPDLA